MESIVKSLSEKLNLDYDKVEKLLEIPPSEEMGDYAFPCFGLAKKQKKSPLEIAKDLTEKFKTELPEGVFRVDSKGSYVNFFIDKKYLAKIVFDKVFRGDFGKLQLDKKKIGIEYPAPNTNKALHIGHLRNMAIGESVSKICEAVGNKVFHLNLFNDRGILISKSMIGYERFGGGKTPESEGIKGDKFVGDFYVKFSKESQDNPELEELAKEKLRLWENGDRNTLELWKKMNDWTYSGIQETFDKFGLSRIEKNYYESEMYKGGKGIVEDGLKSGLFFKKEDGAVAINLENEKLGEKILLRKDGTSVYITTDLFLAEQKVNDFDLDSSYYIVGSDQEYHFKVLFSILDKLGIKKDWKHFSYGMISLPSGKMKSRLGNAPSADDVIDETVELAEKGIRDRLDEDDNVSDDEIHSRSLKIALAAIKYSLLKVDIHRGIVFNSKSSLSFEGDTGPYLLYSYARASSILNKSKNEPFADIVDVGVWEFKLLKKINSFEEILEKSYRTLSPNLVANYCFELSQIFNEFYHACPVIGSKEENFRLKLTEAFKFTLGRALDLLGIETLGKM